VFVSSARPRAHPDLHFFPYTTLFRSQVVRQRLRLAAVAPSLLDVYAEDGMTLEHLMAFTVNPDHARQEQVREAVQHSPRKEPYRSEEHTSELQSRENLVCRLLLEKKK